MFEFFNHKNLHIYAVSEYTVTEDMLFKDPLFICMMRLLKRLSFSIYFKNNTYINISYIMKGQLHYRFQLFNYVIENFLNKITIKLSLDL